MLSSGSGAITGFSVSAADGSLTADGSVSGFAAGAAGLIAVDHGNRSNDRTQRPGAGAPGRSVAPHRASDRLDQRRASISSRFPIFERPGMFRFFAAS